MSVTATSGKAGEVVLECSACPQMYYSGVNTPAWYIGQWIELHTSDHHTNPPDDALQVLPQNSIGKMRAEGKSPFAPRAEH